MNLETLPRVSLAALPTPVQELPRLSRALGRTLWIKRDDLTGLALGGNKTRKLELLCAEALGRKADTLITVRRAAIEPLPPDGRRGGQARAALHARAGRAIPSRPIPGICFWIRSSAPNWSGRATFRAIRRRSRLSQPNAPREGVPI